MVTHEREHLRALDHRLILLGLALLVLCPFSPVLWWQFSRLKFAIEMDCAARVLAGRRDVRMYAALYSTSVSAVVRAVSCLRRSSHRPTPLKGESA